MEYNQASLSGNTKTLMVLLHGLGSNGDDLFSLVPYLAPQLTDTHFYSPDGIEPCDMVPFGYQWFSLADRSPHKLSAELERVIPIISKIIEDKAASLGLTKADVILFGFSQGTMVSLSLALASDEAYKAVLGFSGRLYMPAKVNNTK
jgi:phospholipase/carboxylesterase